MKLYARYLCESFIVHGRREPYCNIYHKMRSIFLFKMDYGYIYSTISLIENLFLIPSVSERIVFEYFFDTSTVQQILPYHFQLHSVLQVSSIQNNHFTRVLEVTLNISFILEMPISYKKNFFLPKFRNNYT